PPAKRAPNVPRKAGPEAAPEAPPAKKAARAAKKAAPEAPAKAVPEAAPEAAAPQNLQEAARDLPPDEFQKYLRSHIDELMREFPEAPPARNAAARQATNASPDERRGPGAHQ